MSVGNCGGRDGVFCWGVISWVLEESVVAADFAYGSDTAPVWVGNLFEMRL